jgi:hypothetical protein
MKILNKDFSFYYYLDSTLYKKFYYELITLIIF